MYMIVYFNCTVLVIKVSIPDTKDIVFDMKTYVFVKHTIFHKNELNQKENIQLSNNSTTVFFVLQI